MQPLTLILWLPEYHYLTFPVHVGEEFMCQGVVNKGWETEMRG